jgi:SRSO17 transposase
MALPKTAVQTVSFVDEYCDAYKNIFSEVRTFENFKFLHLGIISEIQRKSLTRIAKVIGLKDSQPLNNFLKNSPWDVNALRSQRLMWLKEKLNNRSFILVINEIGDKKKGNTTDYVTKQYMCQLAKTENAIVSVNAYGVLDGITFPLIFKVFKPQNSLEANEDYKTKPQLAIAIIQELKEMGFNFNLVIAEPTYRKNKEITDFFGKWALSFLLPSANSANYALDPHNSIQKQARPALPISSKVEQTRSVADRSSDSTNKTMLEEQTEINSIKSAVSSHSTWHIKGEREEPQSYKTGEIYNFVNWVEYGFKQVKQELGWGDFRVTNYRAIERWWEIIFSVYWMISLHSNVFQKVKPEEIAQTIFDPQQLGSISSLEEEMIWHHRLSNLQSIIQL